MKAKKVEHSDILISFNIVKLFTKIPLNEVIHVVKEVADLEMTKLAEVCLHSTFLGFQGECYEQIIGVAMGSPLSPIVSNLLMEKFEKKPLDSYLLKSSRWKRYVDDTNVNWSHGNEDQDGFFKNFNIISKYIKFIMELKAHKVIPFLDVLITRNIDETL